MLGLAVVLQLIRLRQTKKEVPDANWRRITAEPGGTQADFFLTKKIPQGLTMKKRSMKNQILGKTALASLAAAALCVSGQLSAQAEVCDGVLTQVSGKIVNNAQPPGSGLSTLGVVALNGDSPIGKMKCGIAGVSRSADENDLGEDGLPLPLLFTHTISCDDKGTLFPDGPATHSQLTFHTKGTFTDYPQVCPGPFGGISAPFIEYSAPIPGSGRGIFTDTTGGLLTITGTINCVGTIDMKFSGEICLPE